MFQVLRIMFHVKNNKNGVEKNEHSMYICSSSEFRWMDLFMAANSHHKSPWLSKKWSG